ncbi:hypothetical protein L9F63_012615 [Diploptera punctata]|uniref:Uncharacterized protein n=1 Tax=Diploptera punctata TaxID=6984 RepID=A0AAD8ACT0_DIPPU|nr:hypothetical protein L9F63_012615 [Diploptera punctata]
MSEMYRHHHYHHHTTSRFPKISQFQNNKLETGWKTLPAPTSRLKPAGKLPPPTAAGAGGTVIVRTNPPAQGAANRVAVNSGQATSLQSTMNGTADSIRNSQAPTSYHGENVGDAPTLQDGHYDAVKVGRVFYSLE